MRPVLFSLGRYDLLTSPVVGILGAWAAFFYLRAQRGRLGLPLEKFWELVLALLSSAVLGGAVGQFLLYDGGPAENWRYLSAHRALRGGALYGSLWGGIAGGFFYCRRARADVRRLADIVAGMFPLALAIKRLGCLAQGCCYGRPTNLPWGLAFTDPRSHVPRTQLGVALHPTQAYEALLGLGLFLFIHLHAFARVKDGRYREGSAFCLSLGLYAGARFLLDPLRGAPPGPGVLDFSGLDTSRILSLASAGAAVLFYRNWKARG